MRKKNVNFPNHQPGLNIHFFQLWVLCKVTCGFIPQGKLGKLLEFNTFKDSTRKYLECFLDTILGKTNKAETEGHLK